MICGHCGQSFSLVAFLLIHWKQTGCHRGHNVWRRVLASKRAGHSGRRILHEAYPHIYPSEPMPEELKERWAEQKATA
jgi:hypothetical protein